MKATTILAAGISLAAAAGAATPPLVFGTLFDTAGEPAQLHFTALYRAGNAVHRMALWRDGDRRIARESDGKVAIYATHVPGDPGYKMAVLDLSRRIRTDIDRTNLYRIGNFSDWYDLGHGLRHPKGHYRLAAATVPAGLPRPVAACRWYALTEAKRTSDICWSASSRIPLLIAVDGTLVWRVTDVDRSPIPRDRFTIHDAGFVRYDAAADIEKD